MPGASRVAGFSSERCRETTSYARTHSKRRPAAQRVLALAVGNSAHIVTRRGDEIKSDPAATSSSIPWRRL
jgi:hypothetical protein